MVIIFFSRAIHGQSILMAIQSCKIIILILKNNSLWFIDIFIIINSLIYRQSIYFCALDIVGLIIITEGGMIME